MHLHVAWTTKPMERRYMNLTPCVRHKLSEVSVAQIYKAYISRAVTAPMTARHIADRVEYTPEAADVVSGFSVVGVCDEPDCDACVVLD